MPYLNGTLALLFFVIAITTRSEQLTSAMFLLGALLAVLLLKHPKNTVVLTMIGLVSAAVMLGFFAKFVAHIQVESELGWYMQHDSMQAAKMLFGAYGTMFILSEYSCRLKMNVSYADCNKQPVWIDALRRRIHDLIVTN